MSNPTAKNEMELKIAQLLAQGDREAVRLAYRHYGKAVYGIILRVMPKKELAEEVLQDTFVKVWQNADKYDASKGRLFTWLANIARNTAIDKKRSAKYQQSSKTDSLDGYVYEDQRWSTNASVKDTGLAQVIQSLDEKYRVLIEKAYFEGYTQSQLEKELELPLGTVKSRLRKAINELRLKLESDISKHLLLILFLTDLLFRGY